MNYKITLPEQEIKPENRDQKNRAMITEDFEKNGVLARVLVFAYLNQPVSVTNTQEKLTEYYKIDFDRAMVSRALQKLTDNGILYKASSGYVLSLKPFEQKEIHRRIIEKFHIFLSTIPQPFRSRYQEVNYFWLSNGDGLKCVPWACKLLSIPCEIEDEKKQ